MTRVRGAMKRISDARMLSGALVVLLSACGSSTTSGGGGQGTGGSSSSSATTGGLGGSSSSASSSTTSSSSSSGAGAGGAGTGGAPSGDPTAADLLAKLGSCNQISTGLYKTDEDSASATVAVCGLKGAVYWQADMDVDCDGKMSAQCNIDVDPAYQDQTSATDSNGDPLDAATLPFVVVPLPSNKLDYQAVGLDLGSVIAVIYKGKLAYGVFGDEGPKDIIGEASYAMAKELGIDPDPSFGGTDGPVTYIAFTGASAVASPIESHAAAISVGTARAKQLLQEN
ncbi:secreted protein [Minicystis rosea]|nr:secreted protein [Minicystis rosea]